MPESTPKVILREVRKSDLDVYFQNQNEQEAIWMAAFTPPDPSDREAFDVHWRTVLADKSGSVKTVVVGGKVAGHVLKYDHDMGPEVSYWLGKEYWGKGIATEALKQFLKTLPMRPVFARVAKDNIGSFRVLQKCGFRIVGEGSGYANGRMAHIEEYILKLEE